MRLRQVALIPIALVLLFPFPASSLERVYVEMGAGTGVFHSAGGFFERESPGLLWPGLFANFSTAWVAQPQTSLMALHLGAMYRFASVNEGAQQLSIHAFYPFIRLEASQRFFLTLGATPLLLLRSGEGWGIDGLSLPRETYLFLTEVGYNARITPAFSFVFTVSAQTGLRESTFSPLPILEGSIQMRFWLDPGDNFTTGSSEARRNKSKYEGWRYPYGRERN